MIIKKFEKILTIFAMMSAPIYGLGGVCLLTAKDLGLLNL